MFLIIVSDNSRAERAKWLSQSTHWRTLSLFLLFPLSGVRCCLQLFHRLICYSSPPSYVSCLLLPVNLHENYSWQVRQLHEQSDTLEGLFIDIYGDNLAKHITLGNIYRPPKCNNNDQVISTFINELAPVITKLGKECSETIIVGDFNIDLLKVGERQKYAEYLVIVSNK